MLCAMRQHRDVIMGYQENFRHPVWEWANGEMGIPQHLELPLVLWVRRNTKGRMCFLADSYIWSEY